MLRRRTTVLACALAGLLLAVSGCTLPTTDNGGGYGPPGQSSKALEQPDQPPPVVLKSGVAAVLKARDSRWWAARYVAAPDASIVLEVVNSDGMQHNFTLEGEGISKNLPSGAEELVKFSGLTPGRHRFYCKYQREEMQGWITIQ